MTRDDHSQEAQQARALERIATSLERDSRRVQQELDGYNARLRRIEEILAKSVDRTKFSSDDLPKAQGQVQLLLAVYHADKGWAWTRMSQIRGGRHLAPVPIDADIEDVIETLTIEVRTGFRSLQNVWKKEHGD